MNAYTVTVRTEDQRHQYQALGHSSFDVYMDALDRFGLCGVTVTTA